jgi:hypothetical protein
MASESGDMKLLGNFSKLIELISVNPDYNPANPAIKLPALNAQKTAALAAITEIGSKEAPFKMAVNNRQEAFEGLRSVVSRAGNMLQASGASKKIIDDAKTESRKISGRRKKVKAEDDPNTPQDQASKSHSVSQLSYENMVGNFDDFIEVLAAAPTYNPNEADLKTLGLSALSGDLKAKNEAVNTTFAPVGVARGVRDQLLYQDDGCVVNNALLVKAYVRAAFGADSQTFKNIKGLQFKRPKK